NLILIQFIEYYFLIIYGSRDYGSDKPIQHILEGNLTKALNDTVFELVLALRQGYDEGQIEALDVILRHARGETITIADWRKFWMEVDTDLKLDVVRLQFPVSESDERGKEKDQSTAFWYKPRRRFRQDDRSNSGRNNQNFQPRYNTRGDFRSQGRGQKGGRGDFNGRCYRGNRSGHNRDNRAVDSYYNANNSNLFSVAPWPLVQSVPEISSNTVIPDLTQRQIGGPTSQLSSEATSSNIIPIPAPRVHSVQQEQNHLFHPPAAVSPPPINPSNTELPLVVDIQPKIMIQPVNNVLATKLQVQNQQQLPDPPNSWSMQGQERITDPYATKSKELSSQILNGWDAYEFGSQKQSFNPNQCTDNLSSILSKDQQEYSYDSDEYRLQRDEDLNNNDDVFGDADLIELQVRGHRGKGTKNRGRGQAQSQAQPQFIQSSAYLGKYIVQVKSPWTEAREDWSSQWDYKSQRLIFSYKTDRWWSDFNFGSSMDIDMEQMMERDLTQTQPTTNDDPIISTAPPKFETASWHAGEENASAFVVQRANIQHLNDRNEMSQLQQGHLAAQSAYGLGLQSLIGPGQEQSEDEPEQNQRKQDLNNIPDNQENKGLIGLKQETRRSDANKSSIKTRLRSSSQEEEEPLTAPTSPPDGTC
ncbi:MAG: hypothetical protein EZS28_022812, partial [Streblomastix strix]